MLEAVSRPKIRDIVAEKLTDYITSEGLQPGDRLPDRVDLNPRYKGLLATCRRRVDDVEHVGFRGQGI